MHCNKGIISIALLCTSLVYAQDCWFFGTQPVLKPVAQEYVCPIDPPLGHEVYIVLIDDNRFQRLGVWSQLTLARKELVHSYIDRVGGVTKNICHQLIFLACGVTSEKDPRFIQLVRLLRQENKKKE